MTHGDIIDAKQVAQMLKVSYRTVMRLAEQKEIPGFRVGGQRRFRVSDIEAYINRQIRGNAECQKDKRL